MKTYKKVIISIIFTLFIVLCFNKVQAASNFDLENLSFDAKLNTDGSMDVTETWQIHVKGTTNTLFKTFEIDNSKYNGLSNVSVSELINGEEVPFTQSNTWKNHADTNHFHALEHKGEFEIAWGINVSRGNHTYIVRYKVNNVVTVHNDCAELYWQFIGADFSAPAEKVTGKITLPDSVKILDNLRVWGHGQLNGYAERENNNTVLFDVTPFITGKYLEIRVAILEPEMFPDAQKRDSVNAIQPIIDEETNWANKANKEREEIKNKQQAIRYGITGVSVIVGVGFIVLIVKAIKKLKETPIIEPIQRFKYYREIPNENETPAEVAFLYYYGKSTQTKVMPKVLSATLLDLSLKKYISFEVDDSLPKKEQVTIKLINDPNAQNLKESERLVLELFKKIPKDSSIPQFNMNEFEKYAKKHNSSFLKSIEKIQKQAKQEQIDAGHYNKEMEEHSNNWKVAGISIIILLAFVSVFLMVLLSITIWPLICVIIPGIIYSVLCFAISGRITGLTGIGVDEKEKWEGLKRYMQEYSQIKDREVPELIIWEKYLVYATLFGNAEQVLKQLKMAYPEFNNNEFIRNTTYFYLISHTNFNDSFVHSIDSAMTKAYQSSVASSHSSSGGGYGGGFSGGGGGRRRGRPEAAEDKNKSI